MKKSQLPKWLRVVRENVSQYEREVLSRERLVATSEAIALLLHERLGRLLHEEMVVLCLDNACHLMHLAQVAQGGVSGCGVTVCDVLRVPCAVGATQIILVHNHPSGDPTPSIEDVAMTKYVYTAADIVGIPLVDHVVLAGTRHASMARLGLIKKEEWSWERSRS